MSILPVSPRRSWIRVARSCRTEVVLTLNDASYRSDTRGTWATFDCSEFLSFTDVEHTMERFLDHLQEFVSETVAEPWPETMHYATIQVHP